MSSNTKTTDEFLSLVVEHAHDAYIVCDPSGQILYVNAGFEELTGHTRDEVVGRPASVLGSEVRDAMLSSDGWVGRDPRKEWSERYNAVRADGTSYTEASRVSTICGEDGVITHLVCHARDVSNEAALESQLNRAQKLQAIGELASGIAHEINTPVQYVGDNLRFFDECFQGMAAVLAKYRTLQRCVEEGEAIDDAINAIEATSEEVDLEFLEEEISGAVTRAQEGVRRVAEIVRALKEFAHPGGEGVSAVEVNRCINNTIAVARNEWRYVADIETDLDESLPPVVGYTGPFNQVILNLIVNAAHAISDTEMVKNGGKGLITITTRKDGEFAHVAIRDTGGGIPEGIRDRIFNPFFTTKGVGKGTGQGLACAHAIIVDEHDGQLTFDTEIGDGTTFHIRIPLEGPSSGSTK